MTRSASISRLHFHPASREKRACGLLGWANIEIGELLIDGIAVRKTVKGTLTLSFPERIDRHGARHAIARPLDDAARRSIEAQVIDALRAQGWLS